MGEEVSKIEELQKELEDAKTLAEEYLSGWKRAKADLINYQKDIEKQRADWIKFSKCGIVLAILPIYESVERFVEQIAGLPSVDNAVLFSTKLRRPDLKSGDADHPHPTSPSASGGGGKEGEAYIQGVKNIKKQFDDLFKNFGVIRIKTIGERFDPNFHECVSVKKEGGEKSGEISEEAQAGYLMDGEVIKAAKVVVAE